MLLDKVNKSLVVEKGAGSIHCLSELTENILGSMREKGRIIQPHIFFTSNLTYFSYNSEGRHFLETVE